MLKTKTVVLTNYSYLKRCRKRCNPVPKEEKDFIYVAGAQRLRQEMETAEGKQQLIHRKTVDESWG